ncbi:sugar transferase [Spirosoma sp. HMF3257]|uniref:Sugar transferase n=1 Tax=Spirosoma telluris TaxID=2183553 RepID=A0A327NFB4_9BACT|nr:sugar transferase [Spirosoma telluris]RAI73912.1 sugar transferase [Spirosoma telluris]
MVSEEIKPQGIDKQKAQLGSTYTIGYSAKRAFDLVMSILITIFFLSWMIPLIWVAIVLSSPGPAIFVQLRSGRNGQQFRCLKFRTMYTSGTDSFLPASKNDPRVTPLGRVLRRTNLDELPQFLNVLLGDMSLVGPRPHPLDLDAEHWFTLPNYPQRYGIRPGITGLAQVRGCRGSIAYNLMMKHRVRYDLLYIQKASLSLDIYICFRTLLAMFTNNTDAY